MTIHPHQIPIVTAADRQPGTPRRPHRQGHTHRGRCARPRD